MFKNDHTQLIVQGNIECDIVLHFVRYENNPEMIHIQGDVHLKVQKWRFPMNRQLNAQNGNFVRFFSRDFLKLQ